MEQEPSQDLIDHLIEGIECVGGVIVDSLKEVVTDLLITKFNDLVDNFDELDLSDIITEFTDLSGLDINSDDLEEILDDKGLENLTLNCLLKCVIKI